MLWSCIPGYGNIFLASVLTLFLTLLGMVLKKVENTCNKGRNTF